MNEVFEKLSVFIADAVPGDPLPRAFKHTIDDAFAHVAHVARTSSRRARSNRTTTGIRILIDGFPEWRCRLSEVEQRIVDVKFGTRCGGPSIELTNDETGAQLDISKQMVAYHLKTILQKLESEFGSRAAGSAKAAAAADVHLRKDTPLREDPEWKRVLRWWRVRSGKTSEEISAQDLEFLKIVETRLSEIGSEQLPNRRTGKSRPGRKRSPAKYFALRELLTGKPELLERLTTKQREAMRIGLALGEGSVANDAELGFRRFIGRDSMTKENFNYLLREVVKRLDAEDRETVR